MGGPKSVSAKKRWRRPVSYVVVAASRKPHPIWVLRAAATAAAHICMDAGRRISIITGRGEAEARRCWPGDAGPDRSRNARTITGDITHLPATRLDAGQLLLRVCLSLRRNSNQNFLALGRNPITTSAVVRATSQQRLPLRRFSTPTTLIKLRLSHSHIAHKSSWKTARATVKISSSARKCRN